MTTCAELSQKFNQNRRLEKSAALDIRWGTELRSGSMRGTLIFVEIRHIENTVDDETDKLRSF